MTTGEVLVLRGRGDDDLLRPAGDVRLRLGRVGEEPGGLEDDVGAEVTPGELRGVAFGEGLDQLVADLDAAVDDTDRPAEAAEDRVVLEQVGLGCVVTEVVERDHLDVGARCLNGTEEVAANAAEAVDTDANSHV